MATIENKWEITFSSNEGINKSLQLILQVATTYAFFPRICMEAMGSINILVSLIFYFLFFIFLFSLSFVILERILTLSFIFFYLCFRV
jgi:hypothetical protein